MDLLVWGGGGGKKKEQANITYNCIKENNSAFEKDICNWSPEDRCCHTQAVRKSVQHTARQPVFEEGTEG